MINTNREMPMAEIAYIKDDVENWTACVQQHLHFLPNKALRRVTRSIAKPQSNLLPLLALHLYNEPKKTYLPVSDRVFVPGYNHEQAENLFAKNISMQDVAIEGIQFFANTLTIQKKNEAGKYLKPPSERIINCGFYIHTFEVDPTENYQAGLAEQISWCIGGKKDIDCKIGEIYKELSRFKDFRGLEYV